MLAICSGGSKRIRMTQFSMSPTLLNDRKHQKVSLYKCRILLSRFSIQNNFFLCDACLFRDHTLFNNGKENRLKSMQTKCLIRHCLALAFIQLILLKPSYETFSILITAVSNLFASMMLKYFVAEFGKFHSTINVAD